MRVTATDGVQLAVTDHGGDGPTVILVHGFPDASDVWGAVVPLLHGCRVVTFDLRGQGASDTPGTVEGYDIAQLAQDVVTVADAVSPDEPVHVVGHDWGGILSFEVATNAVLARRVASVTVVAGASFDHAGRLWRSREHVGAFVEQARRSWYMLVFRLPAVPEAVLSRGSTRLSGPLRRRLGFVPGPTFDRNVPGGLGMYRANLDRVLRPRRDHVHVPLQVVAGDEDPFLSVGVFDELPALAPRAWRRVVHGGHWLPRTHPELVARMVRELVDHVGGAEVPELDRDRLHREPTSVEALAGAARVRRGKPWAGRLAVVTGAGNGIGRATAIAAADRGADLVLVDLDPDAAARAATFVRHRGVEAHVRIVDVADGEAMASLAKDVVAELGTPDLVVNNAGIGMSGPFLATSDADWERILGVNLWGVVRGSRLFARAMVDAGRPGHVVNVASGLAYTPAHGMSAYAATKAAVLMLSEVQRNEFAAHGIGVSAICPGIVDTGITDRTAFVGVDEDEGARRRRASTELYRRRRLGPDAVAAAVLRAVDDDVAVVPVGVEAVAGRWLSRLSPGLVRRVAATDVLGGSR